YKLDAHVTKTGLQIEDQRQPPFVVAEPEVRCKGLAVGRPSLNQWRYTDRLHGLVQRRDALDTVYRELRNQIAPALAHRKPDTFPGFQRQRANVEERAHRVAC